MMSLTIRLIADINESLDQIAQETGIVKTSFILYILNQQLNCDSIRVKTSLTFRGQQIVRTTLRLPDALRVKLESAAEENHISVNQFVNQCLYEAIHLRQNHCALEIHIPQTLYQDLLTISKRNHRPVSEEIIDAVKLYCKKYSSKDESPQEPVHE